MPYIDGRYVTDAEFAALTGAPPVDAPDPYAPPVNPLPPPPTQPAPLSPYEQYLADQAGTPPYVTTTGPNASGVAGPTISTTSGVTTPTSGGTSGVAAPVTGQDPVYGGTVGGAGDIVGDKESDAEKLTRLQKAYAPYQEQAGTLYAKALEAADRAAAYEGPGAIREPTAITAGDVTAQGVTAGQVTAPTESTRATSSTATLAGPVERYQAALAEAAKSVPIERVTAGTVAAPRDVTLGPVNTQVTADQLGPAAQTRATAVERVGLDRGEANAIRAEQVDAARGIKNAPSAAAAALQAAMAKTARQTYGMASQARGADRAGLRREAMLANASAGVEAGAHAAAEAAREKQAALQGYAQALGGIRTTDVDVTKTGAQLSQEAANLQAQIDAAAARGDMEAINALRTEQARLNLQARTATLGADVDVTKARAGVDTANADRSVAVDTGNVDRALAASTTNADAYNTSIEAQAAREQQAILANQAATNTATASGVDAANTRGDLEAQRQTTVEADNVARALAQEDANLNRGIAVDTTNVGNTLAADTTTATEANRVETADADRALAADTTNVTTAQERDIAQGQQDISTQQTINTGTTGALAAGTSANESGISATDGATGAKMPVKPREPSLTEQLLQGGLAAGAMALSSSDERVKRDVHEIPEADLADLAEKMRTVTWRYKPGVEDGGKEVHAGTTAQSLEKSKLGKTLVSQTPDGTKQVDYAQLASLMAAAATKSLRKRA